jgi:hypothetical protein
MKSRPGKGHVITIRDGDDDNTVSEFMAFCKSEHLIMSSIVREHMRKFMEDHYEREQILEKAKLVPVFADYGGDRIQAHFAAGAERLREIDKNETQ